MKIYLVSRVDTAGWDEYRAFVVQAESREEALSLCKETTQVWGIWGVDKGVFNELNTKIVELPLGNNSKVILADFNAG